MDLLHRMKTRSGVTCLCQAGKSYILVPNGGHLGLFFYLQLQNNNIKMDYRDKIQLKKWCFQFINSYRSFTRTLAITSYGTEKIETDVDLRGIGEEDLSNSSS